MGRLVKGQIAPGVVAISEAALRSVRRRAQVFESIRRGEDTYVPKLSIFTSAQSLSDWADPGLEISPISVKTLRKHMALVYPEGLAAMCSLARTLLRDKSNRQVDQDIPNFRKQSERAIDAALEMTARYLDVLERFRKLSIKDKDINKELEQHFRKFGRNPHIQEVF